MWRYVALWKIAVFCCFCKNVFFLILEKKVWHYVALCGAMKIAVFCCFCKTCVFLILEKKVWHYVALCGAIKNSCFLLFLQKNRFFWFWWKKWHYEKLPIAVFCCFWKKCVFLDFGENNCGCGNMKNSCCFKKNMFFQCWPKNVTLWPYVSMWLSVKRQKTECLHPFSKKNIINTELNCNATICKTKTHWLTDNFRMCRLGRLTGNGCDVVSRRCSTKTVHGPITSQAFKAS